jgi:hypothetical protein
MAAEISKNVEDRLWRWGIVLGAAGSLFAASLALFGFTSFEGAKDRINQVATAATGTLNSTASAKNTDLEKQAVVLSGELRTEVQQAESVIRSYGVRENAVGANLHRLEVALTKRNAQMEQLNRIRATSPDTPIGSINSQLFQTPNLTGTINSGTVQAYSLGSSGEGVKAIQSRLSALGCYSGLISGTFDSSTADGVIAFKAAQEKPIQDRRFGSPSVIPNPALGPSADQIELNSSDVGNRMWNELFSPFTARCD